MALFRLSLLVLCCALVSADSSSSSSSSSESHEKHKHRRPSHNYLVHPNLSGPVHRYNHPAYPYPPHPPGYGYYGPPYGQYPPAPPGFQQHPGYPQPPHGYQQPPPWYPSAGNGPMGYYPPQSPSSSSSSSSSTLVNQPSAIVIPTPVQPSNPSSSSTSNSSANINQGRFPTEAPNGWPYGHPGNHLLREKTPGEYIYALNDPNPQSQFNQPSCGPNQVCA